MAKVILIIAILLGLVMRGFQYRERFMYNHDTDLSAWIIKDIIVDKHIRLIGQQTTTLGIFIGPLFYYSLIPFYLLGGMDPLPSVAFSWIVSLLGVISIYWIGKKVHSKKIGLIAALIYAVSFGISLNEREVVPTTPVILWSMWFYYCVYLLWQGKRIGLYLLAILAGLIWHLNLALILVLPLSLAGFLKNLFTWTKKDLLLSSLLLFLINIPLLAFEVRHGFSQTQYLISSLTTVSTGNVNRLEKLYRVVYISAKNINTLFWHDLPVSHYLGLVAMLIAAGLWLRSTFFWFGLYILFFSLHPLNVSEYYLNGLQIVWMFLGAIVLSKIPRIVSALILCLFMFYNLNLFFNSPINASGYIQRKQIAEFIRADALAHNYPCVSVSYMTDPGYNLGYRYLFYLNNLHVNQPMSNSPVYTIVFPHTRADRLDKTFGALGLIYPDYGKYTPAQVQDSCSGQNANLTDPMFGFTK